LNPRFGSTSPPATQLPRGYRTTLMLMETASRFRCFFGPAALLWFTTWQAEFISLGAPAFRPRPWKPLFLLNILPPAPCAFTKHLDSFYLHARNSVLFCVSFLDPSVFGICVHLLALVLFSNHLPFFVSLFNNNPGSPLPYPWLSGGGGYVIFLFAVVALLM